MNLEKVYKYQMYLYSFIIAFGVQNYYFNKYDFKISFYENILKFVFELSVITILVSLILLTYESIKTINKKEIILDEILYLIINIILYYIVIFITLYLPTQMR